VSLGFYLAKTYERNKITRMGEKHIWQLLGHIL